MISRYTSSALYTLFIFSPIYAEPILHSSHPHFGTFYLHEQYLQNYLPSSLDAFLDNGSLSATAILMGAALLAIANVTERIPCGRSNLYKEKIMNTGYHSLFCYPFLGCAMIAISHAFAYTARSLYRSFKKRKLVEHTFCFDIRFMQKKYIKTILHGCDDAFIEHVLAARKKLKTATS